MHTSLMLPEARTGNIAIYALAGCGIYLVATGIYEST
jgi:hypothetical protein